MKNTFGEIVNSCFHIQLSLSHLIGKFMNKKVCFLIFWFLALCVVACHIIENRSKSQAAKLMQQDDIRMSRPTAPTS